MGYVKTFSQLSKKDVVSAGGKGASLSEMFNSGIPVPDGFVILASTFEEFLKNSNLTRSIKEILDSANKNDMISIDSASNALQALIKSTSISEDVIKEIYEQFEKLGTDFAAVRSSATAEDGTEYAWAGQLDSYLNTTSEQLIERVKDCWASLFTPRAIFYRLENGLSETDISIAVVVQKMVNSEKSGIAFSVHPVSQNKDHIIIEAGFGLGEAIVSGAITPDSYIIQKSHRSIIDINVSSKKRALYRNPTGGNDWIDLDYVKSKSQVLTDDEILKLAEIIITIENHYGFPCDIEWAYEEGNFYIVQSRPITTLSKDTADDVVITEPMKDMGKRRPDIRLAFWKIRCWSFEWEQEVGIGYKTMVINSDGEIWGDEKSTIEMYEQLDDKGVDVAMEYIQKMADLNTELTKHVETDPHGTYDDGFVKLLTYFFIVRRIIANTFEGATEEQKEFIDKWRNYDQAFSSMDTYLEINPVENPKGDWSVVLQNGKLQQIPRKISFHVEKDLSGIQVLKGSIGYPGKGTGSVRVIQTRADMDAFEEGEILVASMTFPRYLPIIAKSAAFVTDEGGITSHAAVTARELKKPCVIGTKFATQVLKTGDIVEVDAFNGIVRKIS